MKNGRIGDQEAWPKMTCGIAIRGWMVTAGAALLVLALAAPVVPAVSGSGAGTVTDVIVGRNTKGPYPLSWTNMDPDSVRVVINGMTLKPGENYGIDYAKGMIAFTSNVLNDAIVRVSYSTIPNKSQPNTGKMSVPVTLNVFQRQDANVQVTGLYAQDDAKNPDAGKTVVGVGGEKKWGASKVGSQFFVSQRNATGKPEEGDAWDRSAFKVGSETTVGKFKVGGSLLHAGKDFAGGTETGLGVGKRAGDLSVAFAPASGVEASVKLQESEDTGGATKGSRSSLQEQSVAVTPIEGAKLAVTHSLNKTSTAAANSGKIVDATAVTVDQKLGAATASVSAGMSTTVEGGTMENVHSQGAGITSGKVSANVNLTHKDSTTALGQSSKTDLGVEYNPFKHTQIKGRRTTDVARDAQEFQNDFSIVSAPVKFAKVSASVSQKGINENDDVTKQAAVEMTPFANTQVSAGVKYVEAGARVMTIKDYAASAKALNLVSFIGSLRQRDALAEETQDTAAMEVAVTPLKSLAVTGGYQSNPEDETGNVQVYNATNVGLRVKFGSVGVTTDYKAKNEYRANKLSDEGNLGVELPVFRAGKLATGVKIARMLDGSSLSTNTYSLGYKHDLGAAFNFSLTGFYTQYMKDKTMLPEQTEYSATANLGVKF